VVADRASVIFRGVTIGGDVTIGGGGGGPSGACARSDVPVSFVPCNALEDSAVGGSVPVSGYRGCWKGFFRDTIGGNVTLLTNTVEDPDDNELADNSVGNNLKCCLNAPAPHFGDSGGGSTRWGGSCWDASVSASSTDRLTLAREKARSAGPFRSLAGMRRYTSPPTWPGREFDSRCASARHPARASRDGCAARA
jgi:hypothetical protein